MQFLLKKYQKAFLRNRFLIRKIHVTSVFSSWCLFMMFAFWLIIVYGISTLVGHLMPNPVFMYM